MNRIPVPGEVWSSRLETATATIDKVVVGCLQAPDQVAYTCCRADGESVLFASTLDSFLGVYAHAEPWEQPEPVERWASVCADGSLLVAPAGRDKESAIEFAIHKHRPAICRVLVSPIEGSVERVSP